ncbi:MAG: ABC transporter ATP-binding protein [Acidimicrobiales bacterium]|jgi:oligopeptide/dipeptide ABC transporter ATP-binding protein
MSPKRHVREMDDLDDRPLLQVEDVKTYFQTAHGLVRSVDGVTFDLERGRTLAIVGESGSGKSVLSQSIMGLLPPHGVVREGRVRFGDVDLTKASVNELRDLWGAQIAMIFQDPATALNPVVRVGRQVTESLRYHLAMSRDDARQTAIALLRSVGLPEPEQRLRWYPHQFSGGMQQRIVIAVAIACGPKLLLADEPTTGLDVTVSAQILDLINRLQQERYMSVILVTHDLGVVTGRADDVLVMYAGKIVERAPTAVLFRDMRMPYTEALLRSAPRLANPSHTRLHAIPGSPPNPADLPQGCRFAARCPYVQSKCIAEEPPLRDADSPNHQYACWYPVGTPEGRQALEDNQAKGVPAAVGVVN